MLFSSLFVSADANSQNCFFFLFQMVPQLLVLSRNAMLVLDQRTLAIKYRIPVAEVEAISLSPFPDKVAIFHLKKLPEVVSILVLELLTSCVYAGSCSNKWGRLSYTE